MKSYDHAACQAVVQPFKKSVKETQRSVSNPPFPSPTFSFQNIHAHTNKVRFRNQISTLPQPNFDDSATKIRYASATQKKALPQPKKKDSATKKGRFHNQNRRFRNQKQTIPQPKSARFGNQNPRHFATKICASTLCMASSPSATLNMASSSDAVGWGGTITSLQLRSFL